VACFPITDQSVLLFPLPNLATVRPIAKPRREP
jgi:hypothetical protein